MLVVDDALLLDVLAGVGDPDLQSAADRGEVHTTGCWYYRLSRALQSEPMVGALSRRLASTSRRCHPRTVAGRTTSALHLAGITPNPTAAWTAQGAEVIRTPARVVKKRAVCGGLINEYRQAA